MRIDWRYYCMRTALSFFLIAIMLISGVTVFAKTEQDFLEPYEIEPEKTLYYVNVNALSPGKGAYFAEPSAATEGETVYLTALPHEDETFIGWVVSNGNISLGTGANQHSFSFVMPASDVGIVAIVEKKTYDPHSPTEHKLTFSVVGMGGSITAVGSYAGNLSSGQLVDRGENITFTAIPNEGYKLLEWKLNGVTDPHCSTNSFEISNLKEDTNVTVEFVQVFEKVKTFVVQFSSTTTGTWGANTGGIVIATVDDAAISSVDFVEINKTVIFYAAPNSGFEVKDWYQNESVVPGNSSKNTFTLNKLTSDVYVLVVFQQIQNIDLGTDLPTDLNTDLPTDFHTVVFESDSEDESEGSGQNWSDMPSPRATVIETNPFSARFTRWAHPVMSHLAQNADKSITAVTASDDDEIVSIEICDKDGQTLLKKDIPYELPIFGTFFSGEKYNYIAYGQLNMGQNNSREVIRIVKYDKSFNKLGSASVNGGETNIMIPFDAACPRMAEYGDNLIIHTSRERYTSSDGKNHQSNLTITLNSSTMKVTQYSELYPQNHVSHSFDQYVLFDGASPVFLDHGDAFPRYVVLQRAKSSVNYSGIIANMFNIPGESGANQTGVTVGGLAMSSHNYLAAIATIDHKKVSKYTNFEMVGLDIDQRDIVICVIPKSFSNEDKATQTTIGKYIGTSVIASAPRLISNGDGTFTVVWKEFSLSGEPGEFVAQVVNSSGGKVGASRRYEDVNDFYMEFFNVNALPLSARTVNVHDDNDSEVDLSMPTHYLDTASVWAQDNISSAMKKGFVPVDLQDNYKNVISRIGFCRMAVKYVEYATGKSVDEIMAEKGVSRDKTAFTDTGDADILAAFALGITNGTGNNEFTPYGEFNREQAARMLMNVCMVLGKNTDNPPSSGFADMNAVSDWAVGGVDYCFANGIMIGVGENTFSPKDEYTIEQSIATFDRM